MFRMQNSLSAFAVHDMKAYNITQVQLLPFINHGNW